MLKPLGDHIVVRPGPEEEVTRGGIGLPDTARKKPQEGEVVAVGPGKVLDSGQRAAMQVAVGDVVIYTKYGGTEITVDGEDLVILDEGSVLAINPEPKRVKGKKSVSGHSQPESGGPEECQRRCSAIVKTRAEPCSVG